MRETRPKGTTPYVPPWWLANRSTFSAHLHSAFASLQPPALPFSSRNRLLADAGTGLLLSLLAFFRDSMRSSANCLAGCRTAVCPPRGSVLAALKPSVARLTPVFRREIRSKHTGIHFSTTGVRCLSRPLPLSLQHHVSQVTAIARYASHASEPHDEELPTSPPFTAGPYANLTIGVPKESFPGERRVAITPQNVKLLLKKGFSRVLIERGAGEEAQFLDEAYEQAGAHTVDRRNVFSESDILLKVRALSIDGKDSEVDAIREGATVISMLYPIQNKPTVERLASRKATAFAMDMIPRISRAQVFDALSSMANIAGYKAVLEASNHFGRFLTGQVTAAGKILVIGAGVAGLSAIATVSVTQARGGRLLTVTKGPPYGRNCPRL
jgi:NAD(P) transhydrogenase